MSTAYVIALVVAVAVIASARLRIGALPLRGVAVRITRVSAMVAGIGVVGLVFHCGAMFFPSTMGELPGTHRLIGEINAPGAVSQIWYVVAAALVLIGLRRQSLIARVIVALALAAVGVTMYDGGPLRTHLTAIFAAVLVIAAVAAVLVMPPSAKSQTMPDRASA